MDSLDGFLHSSVLSLVLTARIRQSILTHLEEVVPQKQAPQRVLDCFHHGCYVVKYFVRARLMALDVDAVCSDQ